MHAQSYGLHRIATASVQASQMDAFRRACESNDEDAVCSTMPAAVSATFAEHDGVELISEIMRCACRQGNEHSVRGILQGSNLLAQFLLDLKLLLEPAAQCGHVGVVRIIAAHEGKLRLPRMALLRTAARFALFEYLEEIVQSVPIVDSADSGAASEPSDDEVISVQALGRLVRSAADWENQKTLAMLLDTGRVRLEDQGACLVSAAHSGNVHCVAVLCEPPASPPSQSRCPPQETPPAGRPPSRIAAGASIDSAFSSACIQGHMEVVRYLLALPLPQAPSLKVTGLGRYSPFAHACSMGHTKLVQLLLARAPPPGQPGCVEPEDCLAHFINACGSGHRKTAEVFLLQPGKCGIVVSKRAALLSTCIERGHLDIVHMLLQHAAAEGSPLPIWNIGVSPLRRLIRHHGSLHMLIFLLQHGVSTACADSSRVFDTWGARFCPELPDASKPPPTWASDAQWQWLWALQGEELLCAAFNEHAEALAVRGVEGGERTALLLHAACAAAQKHKTHMLRCMRQCPHFAMPGPGSPAREELRSALRLACASGRGLEMPPMQHLQELVQYWRVPDDIVLGHWLRSAAKHGAVEQLRYLLQQPCAGGLSAEQLQGALQDCLLIQAGALERLKGDQQACMLDCACELLWGGVHTPHVSSAELGGIMGGLVVRAIEGLNIALTLEMEGQYSSGEAGRLEVPVGGGLHLLLSASGGVFDVAQEVGPQWAHLRSLCLPIPESDAAEAPLLTPGRILGGVRWAGFVGCPRPPRRKIVLARACRR